MSAKKHRKKKSDRKKRSADAGGSRKKDAPRNDGEGRAAEGKPTDGASPAEEVVRERTAFGIFRDNFEGLLVAVVLALIIRHFSVEAFEIPTGSMGPTLYGMHVWIDSPNTDYRFAAGVATDQDSGKVRLAFRERVVYSGECPHSSCRLARHVQGPGRGPLAVRGTVECSACGTQFQGQPEGYEKRQAFLRKARCPLTAVTWDAVIFPTDMTGGDKIFVNKFAYALGEPQRFEVVVFGFDQWKNYIKRLVGLPGERIQLADGDIYVNGEIVRKWNYPEVQEELWHKVSDSDLPEFGLNATAAWLETKREGVRLWERLDDGRYSINNPASVEPSVFAYQRPLDNYMPYNLLTRNHARPWEGQYLVGDVRLSFEVRPVAAGATAESPAWVGAEIRDGDFTYQVRLPIGSPSEDRPAVIERVSNESAHAARPNPQKRAYTDSANGGRVTSGSVALPADQVTRVDIANLDDTIIVDFDGERVLQLEYVSLQNPDQMPRGNTDAEQYLWLLTNSVKANFTSMQVYVDNYYVRVGSGPGSYVLPIDLGPEEYFCLGDNSPSSSDGRYWGSVPADNFMGRALLIFWPSKPNDWRARFIR